MRMRGSRSTRNLRKTRIGKEFHAEAQSPQREEEELATDFHGEHGEEFGSRKSRIGKEFGARLGWRCVSGLGGCESWLGLSFFGRGFGWKPR